MTLTIETLLVWQIAILGGERAQGDAARADVIGGTAERDIIIACMKHKSCSHSGWCRDRFV